MKWNNPPAKIAEGKNGNQLLSIARGIFSKPIRVKMMRWLCSHHPTTQREIGRALLLSNAAVHHHLKWLLAREIVELHATRPGPNGITEKLYKVNWKVWDPVKNAMGKEGQGDFMLDYTLDGIQECHRVGSQLIKSDWSNRFIAGSFGAFATHREIYQLKRNVYALLEAFRARHGSAKLGNGSPVSLTFAILPSTADNLQGVKTFDMMHSRKDLEKISGKKISDLKLPPKVLEKILALDG